MVTSRASGPQRIIVPVDHSEASEQAIPFVRAIARSGDAVVLLHVVSMPDISPVLLPKPVSLGDLKNELHASATAYMVEMLERINMPDGVATSMLIVDGQPADQIVHEAMQGESSIIVMSTTGRGAASRFAFGSVADRVARTAPVPVFLVRAHPEADRAAVAPIGRVVVPLDGSPRSMRSLPIATAFAHHLSVPVLLVSVNEAERMLLAYGAAFSAAAYAEIAENAEDELGTMLRSAAEQLHAQGIAAEQKILTGATVPAIESVLRPDDLIIMASHGRSGVRRLLLGSVADRLIRTGPVPVMLVPSV